MSIVAQISTDLTSLIAESRRRSPEIKHAAERSLATLKTHSAGQDEIAFLREVSQSSDFITPLLLSCSSRNAKFSTIAVQSLQRLIQVRAVPLSRLDMLLEALTEATRLAVDIQLKVLQILPTLFQTYAEFIGDALLAKLLLICAMLQQPSKLPMVVNTAAATHQQLVLALFDKVIEEDKTMGATDREEFEVLVDEGQKIKIPVDAYDAYRVFSDICSLIERQKPTFLIFNALSESFGLELLENIFTNYHNVFLVHPELAFLVRTRITPLLLRFFSSHKDFSIVVRVSRIILLLVKSQLSILEIEAEVILSLLTHAITTDSNLPQWKKALSLEIFSAICLDFQLTKSIFQTYDFASDKKKIITEFFIVCSSVLTEPWAQHLLNVNEIVSIPTNEDALSAHNSSMRIPLVDMLDKSEAPAIPKTYTLYLILGCTNSLCDGIGKFVLDISRADDNTFTFLTTEQTKSPDATEVKNLISTNAKSLVTIGSEFLYASLGNDLFHTLIRALQKLCHASGVLGLTKERDSLLMLFSIATVSNICKRPPLRNTSISESLVDTVSGAFSAATTPTTPSKKHQFQVRSLNSRHVICFRAFTSLTTSLGPILGHSWRFVLITFQWFDYFVNGPSEYLRFKEIPQKPDLPAQDIKSIEQSLAKFNESTQAYETASYRSFLNELINLATETTFEDYESTEPIDDDEFKTCSSNRDFFLYIINRLSKVNAFRYLEPQNASDWSIISTFLSDVASSNEITLELRVTAASVFNEIIMGVAEIGFSSSSTVDKTKLESMIFDSFSQVMNKMLECHRGEFYNSAESGIIYDTLKTLYELLNRFGPQLVSSWGSVLHIIGSPFKILELFKQSTSQKQLLKSAFEILQLILNDFLHSIPLLSLKDVIDVLQSFCSQTFELNVSFSGVSYYWLISDHLRGIASSEQPTEEKYVASSFEELVKVLETTKSKYAKVHTLWLYLLKSLVHISNISRAEVKNGSVQTFFRIVDSHGVYLNWERSFGVVVQDLLSINLEKPSSTEFEEIKTFVDSNGIVLKGITDLYCRFYLHNKDLIYWEALLNCYKRFVALDIIPLSQITYKSFSQILKVLETPSPEQRDLFFDFWSTQPVRYVASDTDLYQESLIELVGTFERLHSFGPFPSEKIELTLGIFNSLVRFPFLPKYSTDISTPTKLQQAVLKCLEMMEIATDGNAVLAHISSLSLLPFQVRSRILKKLQSVRKKEVPSFIAVSERSLELLQLKVKTVSDFKSAICDGTASKVMGNLIETLKSSSEDAEHDFKILDAGIWRQCLDLLLFISREVVPLISDGSEDFAGRKNEVRSLIIDTLCITLPGNNFERDEPFNMTKYEDFRDIILEIATHATLDSLLLSNLVSEIWKSSFLYANDDLGSHLFKTANDPKDITGSLLAFQVEDYTTSPIKVLSQSKFRKLCLEDLFTFCQPGTYQSLLAVTLPYLICRVVFIIKRFAGAQRLLNRAPAATIQQEELQLFLRRLHELLRLIDRTTVGEYQPLLGVFPLILDNHQYIGMLKHSQGLLNGITAEFYKISSK